MPFSYNLSRSPFSRTFFQQSDPPSGTGADNSAANPNPAAKNSISEERLTLAIEKLLGTKRVNGDHDEALRVSVGENHVLRQRAEDAERRLNESALPEADKKLLDDAKKLLETSSLKTMADVQARLETAATLEGEKTQRARRESLSKVVALDGYDADAVSSLAGALDDEYFTKTVQVDGKPVEAGFVKYKNEQGVEVEKPVAERIAEKWPQLDARLKSAGTEATKAAPILTGYAPSVGAGGGKAKSTFDAIREQKQAEQKSAVDNNKPWAEAVGAF